MSPTLSIETIVAVHKLCECKEVSVDHAPCKCPNEGDYTCVICGRQVCSGCFTGLRNSKGPVCFTCDNEVWR